SVAAGQRMRPDLQPDGGRGNGGDIAGASLAVGPAPGQTRRWQSDQQGPGGADNPRGAGKAEGDAGSGALSERQVRAGGPVIRADDDQTDFRRVPDAEGLRIRVGRADRRHKPIVCPTSESTKESRPSSGTNHSHDDSIGAGFT